MSRSHLRDAANATIGKISQQIAEHQQEDAYAALLDKSGRYIRINVQDIVIDDNIRRDVDQGSARFEELVTSIREKGILEPPCVQIRFHDGLHHPFLVYGQRRVIAARVAGLTRIDCLIRNEIDGKGALASLQLDENLTREDLHALDIAEGYLAMIEDGYSPEEIAARHEKDKATIKRYLKIAQWPRSVRNLIRANLDVFPTHVLFNQLAGRSAFYTEEQLRQAVEEIIAKKKSGQPVAGKDNEIRKLEDRLTDRFGGKVRIREKEGSGSITISYASSADKQKLIEMLME